MNKKVYIASPYTKGNQLENVNVQMDMYYELVQLGFLPFTPLYSHYVHERNPISYDKWMEIDYKWIDVCDYILRLPGESKGADLEIEYAKNQNKIVFYSVEELTNYIEPKHLDEGDIHISC